MPIPGVYPAGRLMNLRVSSGGELGDIARESAGRGTRVADTVMHAVEARAAPGELQPIVAPRVAWTPLGTGWVAALPLWSTRHCDSPTS